MLLSSSCYYSCRLPLPLSLVPLPLPLVPLQLPLVPLPLQAAALPCSAITSAPRRAPDGRQEQHGRW